RRTKKYAKEDMSLKGITVSGKVEKLIAENIQQTEHGNYLSLDREDQQQIINIIREEAEKATINQDTQVILCSPAIRTYLKQLIERFMPQIVVLSYNEL